jgi:hypothetical protein
LANPTGHSSPDPRFPLVSAGRFEQVDEASDDVGPWGRCRDAGDSEEKECSEDSEEKECSEDSENEEENESSEALR